MKLVMVDNHKKATYFNLQLFDGVTYLKKHAWIVSNWVELLKYKYLRWASNGVNIENSYSCNKWRSVSSLYLVENHEKNLMWVVCCEKKEKGIRELVFLLPPSISKITSVYMRLQLHLQKLFSSPPAPTTYTWIIWVSFHINIIGKWNWMIDFL